MALTPGTCLGVYEITAAIGEGGMGQVFRARDTKLDRDVAIKILPEAFAHDAERLARFTREAKTLASLNHPHIAGIYGLEESNGIIALVMELVEGDDLSQHIARGPIPLDEALPIAKQIAEALEAAHEQGIIHRDLKPANIKMRADGTVKVLDFGLAKAMEPAAGSSPSMTMSPTITTPAMTQAGMILGTAAYMSPEQARGRAVDQRSDIWAFGVVLYEMLTGRRAFDGGDVSETIAAVIRAEPDWAGVPARVRPLLESCFEKDPRRRLRNIGDAWRLVNNGRESLPIRSSRSSRPLRAAAVVLLVAAAAILVWWTTRPQPQPAPAQFTIGPAPAVTFRYLFTGASVSRDGRLVVFSGVDGTPQRNDLLYIRPVNSLDARPLSGTAGADHPFWSPDSRTIAYFSDDRLKRIDLAGGGVSTLADAPGGNGGDWNADGVLLYAAGGGLFTVPAAGGVPTLVIPASSSDQSGTPLFPQFLPDGDRFLYLGVANTGQATSRIWVSSLSHPKERKPLLEAAYKAVYAGGDGTGAGRLLFVHGTTLLSQSFDLKALALRGDPVTITTDLRVRNHWAAFWAADARVLMFRGGGSTFDRSTLVWMGRDGRVLGEVAPEQAFSSLRLSPDGDRIAISIRDGGGADHLWIIDSARHTMSRFTFDAGRETRPVWSPDGRQIAFSANRSGTYQLFLKDSRGIGVEIPTSRGGEDKNLTDWSPDGRYLLYSTIEPGNRDDLLAWPLTRDPKPVPIVRTPFEDTAGQFSPDGRWMAYQSTETGRPEVYLQSFPSSGGKWQVSNSGGEAPRWRADGKELFYLTPAVDLQDLMAVDVQLSPGGPQLSTPHRLFSVSTGGQVYPYDVTRDGQRFVVEQISPQSASPPLTIMLNWQEELKQRVPTR